MIRHTNSFLISLIFHSILLLLILYTVKTVSFDTQKKDNEIVCLKLCNVKSQNKKDNKTLKQHAAVVEKKTTPPVKKELKNKEMKQAIVSKKPEVKIEKKEENIQEVLTETEEKKEQPKTEQKALKPPALKLSDNKDAPSCDCKEDCNCDSKQETQEMKNQRMQQAYIDENMQKIVKLLQENLYYPRSARRRGITGEVIVKFSLNTNGEVSFISVISSANEMLSHAAIKTIEDLSGDFPKPKERLVLKLPINYNLK